MTTTEAKEAIRALCPDVDAQIIRDFFSRMDEDYFTTFSPEEISAHIRMSSALDAKHRIRVRVIPRPPDEGEFEVVIVGFDYLSEFSILCGLLSAFALNIKKGDIYSFAREASRRKIVDVFRVSIKAGESFDEQKQRDFEQELQTLAQLLAAGSAAEARERLNRFLTERIERMNEPLSGLLAPVEIHFDNHSSPDWTLMETHSNDAFGFLYAVSNALAMKDVYIHKVKIRGAGREVKDQFFIADRWGRKIQEGLEQEGLRMAIGMIKQFTRFLPEAPDPAKAMRHFDRFLDRLAEEKFPDHIVSFLASWEGMSLLAHLLGSSDFLWDDFLGIHFRDLLPLLEGLAAAELQPGVSNKDALQRDVGARLAKATTFEQKKEVVNWFKDRQVFLIDARHLLAPQVTLIDFSAALTDLAEVVLDETVRICLEHLRERPSGKFTVCGLGKFGGREMGYASDLELLFVHEAKGNAHASHFESLAREVVGFIEARRTGIFHIDLRLRPYGDAGAWSVPFDEFTKYYSPDGRAAAFERQALTKLRWVAGDESLGRRVEAHRDEFTYSDAAWDWQNALHLRRRQMRELVKPGQTNVKYGPGGIIDIEYAVQYLQLLHGKDHPELRVPNTLEALDRLRSLQIVTRDEHDVLRSAYLFFRNLIDGLRIVRGHAGDLVLPEEESEEFKSLARRLGYRERDRRNGAALLAADIGQWTKKVHEYFLGRFKDKASL